MLVLLALPAGSAWAGEPPDQNDPCSTNGRDQCGTTGVGAYKTYQFGLRWFGDYRGAVPDVSGATFCIDLRYWYPGKKYGYVQRDADGLKNRDGDAVGAGDLHRMAYALWAFGRSSSKARQGAVMLYVHHQMGDAAPGEVDPGPVGLAGPYNKIERAAARKAGPYTVTATVPGHQVAGTATTLTVKVESAAGVHMAGVPVTLDAKGAGDLPDQVRTDAHGTATVKFTPTDNLRVKATTNGLAAPLPDLYIPTKGKSARNGQRLVAPASRDYSDTLTADVIPQPRVVTTVSAATLDPGGTLFDTLVVSGTRGQDVTVAANLFGPFGTDKDIVCTGDPVWKGTVDAKGDGTYKTEETTLPTPGYYTYQESIAASKNIAAFTAPCADKGETTIVRGHPAVTTKVSDATITPGAKLSDKAVVTGLGKLTAPVKVDLFGPFDTKDAISCDGTPYATSTLTAKGDGTYDSTPTAVAKAGYYVFHESIAATDAYDQAITDCADAAETTFAQADPKIVTRAGADAVIPGRSLRDHLRISGLGSTPVKVNVDLYGPFASRQAVGCDDPPYRRTSLQVKGDGRYKTPPLVINKVGFYVFREHVAAGPGVTAATTPCAQVAETSLGRPEIITGRGDHPRHVAVAAAGGPSHVSLNAIDAPVDPIGIDLKAGVLGVSANIDRVGWWRDGAAPGDDHGVVLLAGHVDSAKRGAGALFPLKDAHEGGHVQLRAGGRTFTYRVRSVRQVLKANLPAKVFSQRGPPRLVIVTCGGPFDSTTGHYRDNIILTATPL